MERLKNARRQRNKSARSFKTQLIPNIQGLQQLLLVVIYVSYFFHPNHAKCSNIVWTTCQLFTHTHTHTHTYIQISCFIVHCIVVCDFLELQTKINPHNAADVHSKQINMTTLLSFCQFSILPTQQQSSPLQQLQYIK